MVRWRTQTLALDSRKSRVGLREIEFKRPLTADLGATNAASMLMMACGSRGFRAGQITAAPRRDYCCSACARAHAGEREADDFTICSSSRLPPPLDGLVTISLVFTSSSWHSTLTQANFLLLSRSFGTDWRDTHATAKLSTSSVLVVPAARQLLVRAAPVSSAAIPLQLLQHTESHRLSLPGTATHMSEVGPSSQRVEGAQPSQTQHTAQGRTAQLVTMNGDSGGAAYTQPPHSTLDGTANGSAVPYYPAQVRPEAYAQGNMQMYAVAGPSSHYDASAAPAYYPAPLQQTYYQQPYTQQYGQVYAQPHYNAMPAHSDVYGPPHLPQSRHTRTEGHGQRPHFGRGGARQVSGDRWGQTRAFEPGGSQQASRSGSTHRGGLAAMQGSGSPDASATPSTRSEGGPLPEAGSFTETSGVAQIEAVGEAADCTTFAQIPSSARTEATSSPARSLSSLPLNPNLPAKPPPPVYTAAQRSQLPSEAIGLAAASDLYGVHPASQAASNASIMHGQQSHQPNGWNSMRPYVPYHASPSSSSRALPAYAGTSQAPIPFDIPGKQAYAPNASMREASGAERSGPAIPVQQTPFSRFPALPAFPAVPDPAAENETERLREALAMARERDKAWLLRLEAIGFEPERAWKAFRNESRQTLGVQSDVQVVETSNAEIEKGAHDVHAGQSSAEMLSSEAEERADSIREPILGIRLLQRVHDLQAENAELEQMLGARFRDTEPSRSGASSSILAEAEDTSIELQGAFPCVVLIGAVPWLQADQVSVPHPPPLAQMPIF